VNEKNSAGATPLHDAALGGQREMAALVLDRGADIDARAGSRGRKRQRAA
jgi:ankyrin repeat protein